MKNRLFDTKINLVILVSLFFVMVLGCQPEGGELLPIQNENIQIVSSRFENDTAVVVDKNFRLTLYGTWDGRAKIRLVLENTVDNNIKVDFNSSKILDSNGGNIKIDSVYEDGTNTAIENFFLVAPKEKRKLIVGFPLNFSSFSDDPPRIISIILAIEVNAKTKELKTYKIDFKGIERKAPSGQSDPTV